MSQKKQDQLNKSTSLDQNSAADRRKAIKTLVAGGGAVAAAANVDKWAAPMVNSVMLPAHAQTSVVVSPVGPFTSNGASIVGTGSLSTPDLNYAQSLNKELLDFFVPAANAVPASNCSVNIDASVSETQADFCFTGSISGSVTVAVKTSGGVTRMGSGSVKDRAGFLQVDGGTFNENSGNWQVDIFGDCNASNVSTTVELVSTQMIGQCVLTDT